MKLFYVIPYSNLLSRFMSEHKKIKRKVSAGLVMKVFIITTNYVYISETTIKY